MTRDYNRTLCAKTKEYKIAATLVFGLFCITIAVQNGTARTIDRIIAHVNDDVVTQWELDTLVKQRAMELQHVYRFSAREAQQEAEQQRVELLDRLIRQMLLLEAALTLKIIATDVEVEQYITEFKNRYQIETDEEFQKQLNREGLTLVAFREQSERNLKSEKLVMGRIVPRLQIRDSDVQQFFEENRDQLPTKSDKVRLRHLFIAFKPMKADRQAALEQVNAARAAIAAAPAQFETIAQRYTPPQNADSQVGKLIEASHEELSSFPETFQAVLANLKAGEMSEPIEANEGLYVFRVETKTGELTGFRYFIVPLSLSEAAIEAARERIAELFQKLEAGEDFNALTAEHSDDVDTKENGGDLGVRALTELNPKTRNIVAALDTGAYSQPVETSSGLHIFKVDERNTPELSEAERLQIISILRQQRFQEEWDAYTDRLMENAYVKIKLHE